MYVGNVPQQPQAYANKIHYAGIEEPAERQKVHGHLDANGKGRIDKGALSRRFSAYFRDFWTGVARIGGTHEREYESKRIQHD